MNFNDLEKKTSGQRTSGLLLITDIGSTTTKALLLKRIDGKLEFASMAEVPTTVEKPQEDVRIGISHVLKELEAKTGETLSKDGMPSIPYLTTSSAGGGLQMLVFGLTSVETGRIAENTACGAGGIILRTITIDDGLLAVEKMMYIQKLHPDMVLLAGGTDGGAISGVVRLAELLMLADPQPKFRQNVKIPLVYCGNTEARPFVCEVLEDTFEVHIVDNVRPSMVSMNIEPARAAVHELFMDNVMERAPGYSALKNITISDIIPTPVGVENVLKLYGKARNKCAVMIDIGGATTDIFSSIAGNYTRTVAANTGMSYSISNVLAETGIEAVMRHLPGSFSRSSVRDYIYNKTLHPTMIPSSSGEILVEQAVAIEGARTAWRDHVRTCEGMNRVGNLDRMKKRNLDRFKETFSPETVSGRPNTAEVSVIIGAGGVISHADRMAAMRMLTEAFLPEGVTLLAVDQHFRSPHLGVLSVIDSDEALRLFEKECLEEIGYLVAPSGCFKEEEPALEVLDTRTGSKYQVAGGDLLLLPSGGKLEFLRLSGHSDSTDELRGLDTGLPVLIDCRGRGAHMIDRPLASAGIDEFQPSGSEPVPRLSPEPATIIEGEWSVEYSLPYEGEILVSAGDVVHPGMLIGENRFEPPRLYIMDLNKVSGYDRHLSPDEVRRGLLVKEGDSVNLGQNIFKVHRKGLAGFDFNYPSTVRGRVTRIDDNGLIIIREIQNYDNEPHVVDIAGPLGLKPRQIRSYLKFKQDDFVGAGQILASDISMGAAGFVKAPSSGILKTIDSKAGTVTIQYDIRPVHLHAHIAGTVTDVIEGHSASVKGTGTRLTGIVGFGDTGSGVLGEITDPGSGPFPEGSVLFSRRQIGESFLRTAADAGVSGIVAPSITAEDWISFVGRESPVGITGDEDIPFTLILTAGFGDHPMDSACAEFLSGAEGKTAGVSGRTQIRAGVTRPVVIIPD